MELDEYLRGVPTFNALPDADKIRFLAWFIVEIQGLESFTTADLSAAFDKLHLKRPNLTAYLSKMKDRKPPEVLRSGDKYRIEKRTRDDLTAKYGCRDATVRVDKLLADLPRQIVDPNERVFLEEALTCFRAQAFRSAIVMTWNLAYSHFCNWLLANHLTAFNAALPRRLGARPRINAIAKYDDFSELKEAEVINVARTANVITADVNKILKDKLDRRNSAAHPSSVSFSVIQTEEFILDLITNVVLKFA